MEDRGYQLRRMTATATSAPGDPIRPPGRAGVHRMLAFRDGDRRHVRSVRHHDRRVRVLDLGPMQASAATIGAVAVLRPDRVAKTCASSHVTPISPADNVARSAIFVGVVGVVVRPTIRRTYQTKSNGRGRRRRNLGVAHLSAAMDGALVRVVMETSCSCWDAGKDFGRDSSGTCDATDN